MTLTIDPLARLTDLDRKVLDQIPEGGPGVRISTIVARLTPRHAWQRNDVREQDVREILRGFEHLGQARQRNGWWSR